MEHATFINSNMLDSGSYDAEKKVLIITFSGGSTYEYYDVPEEVWKEIVMSDSAGKAFTRIVKGKFEYKRI